MVDTSGEQSTPEPMRQGNMTKRIDPRLLEILVCPLTKMTLEYDPVRQELMSKSCQLAYPIRDGIPIMLADEARSVPIP